MLAYSWLLLLALYFSAAAIGGEDEILLKQVLGGEEADITEGFSLRELEEVLRD
jgi:hypothetical protein